MIDTCADDAKRNRPKSDVVQCVRVSTAVSVATSGPPDADDHTNGNNDAVGSQRNRPEVPDALRRRRNTGRDEALTRALQ